MSYDIFFVRRDPGQTFEDALAGVEEGFAGGDPGPLSEGEREQWDALVPRARALLGDGVELTLDDEETRELTDPATGIGLKLVEGEFEIHVPEAAVRAGDDIALMSTVYALARAVEDVTGLEGFDPQLGESVSDSRTPVRQSASTVAADDGGGDEDSPRGHATPSVATASGPPTPSAPRRWWEFWKA